MKTKRRKYIGIYNEEGSFTYFYRLKNRKTIAFKEFGSKKRATTAYNNQKILADCLLAPKVFGKIMKIDIYDEDEKQYFRSGWGYITEIAKTSDDIGFDQDDIEDELTELKNKMDDLCGLRFCDDHDRNVGYITRRGESLLVCIDTGSETFSGEFGNG